MGKLSDLREKLNLTQEELSEKSGISIRTIKGIECRQKPKPNGKIAEPFFYNFKSYQEEMLKKNRK